MRFNSLLKSGAIITGVALAVAAGWTQADGWDTLYPSNELTNQASGLVQLGGIANTRHNLTMAYMADTATLRQQMNLARNDYFEVCVYCHTPHGANSQVGAPLWNRTVSTRTYQLFSDRVDTDNATPAATQTGQPYTQPGPNSLTCLSCHDGATAIDSIINMPTQLTADGRRAGWNPDAEILEDINLNADTRAAWEQSLDDWSSNALGSPAGADHNGFIANTGANNCLTCHQPGGAGPDFGLFVIGADYNEVSPQLSSGADDLRDDHPIGVRFPMGSAARAFDYNEPDVKKGRIAFWDNNGNNHADSNEIRLYDTGDGYEVECASCHDPHGVPVKSQSGASASLTPSFLRVGALTETSTQAAATGTSGYSANNDAYGVAIANPGSQICLTCHVK